MILNSDGLFLKSDKKVDTMVYKTMQNDELKRTKDNDNMIDIKDDKVVIMYQ